MCCPTVSSPLFRVESYSCRMAGNDKKLYKQQSHQEGQEPQALSPPQPFIIGSPVTTVGSPNTPTGIPPVFVRSVSSSSGAGKGTGPLLWCDTISAKTLFYLRSTLTASFQPDYDFTDAKSEEFSRQPNVKLVKDVVRSNLSALAGDTFISLEPQLWAAIDEEIKLSDCDIYRYGITTGYTMLRYSLFVQRLIEFHGRVNQGCRQNASTLEILI